MENVKSRELVISRLLNAPREIVWEVWTKPGHIKNWWGPNSFTNTIDTMDVKPGGKWEFTMHGPDGTDYKNKSTFKEIVKPERIVFEHKTGPKFTATITFTAEENKTLLKWQMLFESPEEFEQTVKTFKADEGIKQNVEKLEKYLELQPFVIERTYNAPISLVWSAISDKNEMKKWYFDLVEFKPEVGFEFKFLAGDDKIKFLHLCKVTEAIKNKKLAYSWQYDGEPGNSIVAFELFEEGNKTRLKLTHAGLETFPAKPDFAKENFMTGWTSILDLALRNFLEKS